MAVSRILAALVNSFLLLVVFAVLGTGTWLKTRSGVSDCIRFLDWRVMIVGIILLLVALAVINEACIEAPVLLFVYLIAVFVLMILLLAFTVFAFVVTNAKAGQVVSGRGYKEYRLGDFSHWLQRRVNNSHNWAKISSCIRDSNVCSKLGEKYTQEARLFSANLGPVQVCAYITISGPFAGDDMVHDGGFDSTGIQILVSAAVRTVAQNGPPVSRKALAFDCFSTLDEGQYLARTSSSTSMRW